MTEMPSEPLEECSKWQEELDGISKFRVLPFHRHVPDSVMFVNV